MAKWRELGEVPDSDAESLSDSEESQQAELPLPIPAPQLEPDNVATKPTREVALLQNASVWDIPTSSGASQPEETGTLAQQKRIEIHIPTTPIQEEFNEPQEPESSPLSFTSTLDFANYESTTPDTDDRADHTQYEKPVTFPRTENVVESIPEHVPPIENRDSSPQLDTLPKNTSQHVLPSSTVGNDEEVARREAARFSRSLRPRKPIQEHPYLLENAQYSTMFKSHGIRPVRLPTVELRRQPQAEDSQEQDYEDDSQPIAGALGEDATEESQDTLQQDLVDDDRDELAFSSPPRPPHSPRQRLHSENLPQHSQNDEELPALGDLLKKRMARKTKTYGKRTGTPKQSTTRKMQKTQALNLVDDYSSPSARPLGTFDIPPSPPQTSPAFSAKALSTNAPKSKSMLHSLSPKPSSTNVSRDPTPTPPYFTTAVTTDLTNRLEIGSENEAVSISDDELVNQDRAPSSSSPEPEMALQRRIKGVLPASWIRLDQQMSHDKLRKPARRSPDRSPERTNRKGVAQRRIVPSKSNNDVPFFFDDSDDDDTISGHNGTSKILEKTRFPIFEDDAGSVIEEDFIDHMLPQRKRARADIRNLAIKRLKTHETLSSQPDIRKVQQRIPGMLNRSKSNGLRTKNKSAVRIAHPKVQRPSPRPRPVPMKQHSPPRLSILDVVETNAPQFIRIAARAANRRSNKGRSSPTGKHINLGSRQDNIDALGVLQNWRRGKILTRLPSTVPEQPTANNLPLQPISHNTSSRDSHSHIIPRSKCVAASRFDNSRKLVKQPNIEEFIDAESASFQGNGNGSREAEPLTLASTRHLFLRSKTQAASPRPAQLEAVGNEQINRRSFHLGKKVLDAVYRTARRLPPSDLDTQLEQVFRGRPLRSELLLPEETAPVTVETSQPIPRRQRARPKKLLRPRQIDTEAPQYIHANDPLPEDHVTVPEPLCAHQDNGRTLLGLGPYGTNYTHHFEVFPLNDGAFFHDNTLIGQGRIAKAFDGKYLNGLAQSRGQSTLDLDGQPITWGVWDAHTSSEFGVLFDWIADKIQMQANTNEDGTGESVTAVQAADFAVNYLQEVICVPDNESARSFTRRILEVISAFLKRLEDSTAKQDSSSRQLIEVLTRCLLVVLQALQIAGKLTLTESLQIEELLKKNAKQMIRALLQPDMEAAANLLHGLQSPMVKVHGINHDHYTAVGWVVTIRVLQELRTPRLGFWDVASSVMLEGNISSIMDAQIFERLWHMFFALLPLGEFDNAGVIVSGSRHKIPLEGWNLPQKLLNQVFEIYKTNHRQSPTFNNYCRALVGRCHYLVEQWGWRKCSSIIGTIFDFFASQSLSHLRNEEAYRSPQFLEDLAGTPSLAVQPEDRCFHIFLKLLALSIQKLRRYGLIKDVKNLIARVIPNHDRQYLKESDVHENELASLRNHHDLLCTLFWCSPQALRPSVQTLEKLVLPGSSHKEACIINLRAWNQLASFVVSNGEDRTVYKPFVDWQNNIFKQVLDQYSSVETDIQQQFLRMSKDVSSEVSPELMKRIINMNKQAAADVLHFSLRATLDAMRHTQSLAAASSILNTYQLHEVFTRFSLKPSDLDWNIQGVAIEIVDHYIQLIQEFFKTHKTIDSDNSWHGEDAVMVLDRHVSAPFFVMAQSLLISLDKCQPNKKEVQAVYTERTVIVAGRLASLFLQHRVVRLSSFFSTGKYGFFPGLPAKLSLNSRRYLCLFVTILVESHIMDFTGINTTPLELFVCAIAKPFEGLAYEYRLAEALRRQGEICLKDATVSQSHPDYGTNRDLFDRILSLMRRALRFAIASHRLQLQQSFSKALRTAMEHMKFDLKSLVHDPLAHTPYMQFVRMLVPLIKKHDFCPVDDFFYQISNEYTPPSQDPRLQTAQILSYGLKLEDGDTRSLSTLFYFLYSNFKLAMTNGRTEQERAILRQGMESHQVLSFMLGRMLPAIITASVKVPEAWLLLSTYVGSVEELFDGLTEEPSQRSIHREVGEDSMADLLTLLKFVSAAVNHLGRTNTANIRAEFLQTLIQLIRLLNLFGPSLVAYLCLPQNLTSQVGRSLNKEIDSFTDFTRAADTYLSTILPVALISQESFQIDAQRLLEEMRYYYVDPASCMNDQINNFSKHMESDIKKTWYNDGSIISVKGPPKASVIPTQSGHGTAVPAWDVTAMLQELYGRLKEWNNVFDRPLSTALKRRPVVPCKDLLF